MLIRVAEMEKRYARYQAYSFIKEKSQSLAEAELNARIRLVRFFFSPQPLVKY